MTLEDKKSLSPDQWRSVNESLIELSERVQQAVSKSKETADTPPQCGTPQSKPSK